MEKIKKSSNVAVLLPSDFIEHFGVVMEEHFFDIIKTSHSDGNLVNNIDMVPEVAVAVSGGADSMALCYILSNYFLSIDCKIHIHAISVDHRLRAEAAQEAVFVGQELGKLPNISHHILTWEYEEKPLARIQERARAARYALMANFMHKRGIKHLFLGHHQDDQAETFLFRLAKGSGLDGLACMSLRSEDQENNILLCRPFLAKSKKDILSFVNMKNIKYMNDPSNEDKKYARVRLRKSMDILSKEGLTSGRIFVTANRLKRARDALNYIADIEYKKCLIKKETSLIVLKSGELFKQPFDIVLRVILLAMNDLNPDTKLYGVRLNRVEVLCEDLLKPKSFRKRTLKGIIFDYDMKQGIITLVLEHVFS